MKPDSPLTAIPLIPGIRQDVSALAPVGTLKTATNVRYGPDRIFPRPPAPAIVPTVEQSLTSTITGTAKPNFVGRFGNTNALGVDGALFLQDQVSGVFNHQGAYSTCLPAGQTLGFPASTSSAGAIRSAIAVNSAGYLLKACVVGGSAITWRIETQDGVRLSIGSVSPATKVACCAQGANFILVYQNGTDISAIVLTVTAGVVTVVTTATSIATLASAAHYWDISSYDSSMWLFARVSSAAPLVTLAAYNGLTKAIAVDGTFAPVAAASVISIWGDATNGRAWVGYTQTAVGDATFRGFTVNAGAWTAYVGPTTLNTTAGNGPPLFGAASSGRGPFWVIPYSQQGTTPFTRAARFGWLTLAGAADGVVSVAQNVFPISKPDSSQRFWAMTQSEATNWRFQRHVLLRCRYSSGSAARSSILELTTDETPAPLTVANLPSRSFDYFHAIAEGASYHHYNLPRVQQQAPAAHESIRVDCVRYMPANVRPQRQTIDLGDTLAVPGQPVIAQGYGVGAQALGATGADLTFFPGSQEIGFAYRPAVVNATQTVGGTLTTLSTYSWVFVFEWQDPQGKRHRSAPSVPYSVTLTGGNNRVDFVVVGLGDLWDQKASAGSGVVTLISYRTTPSGTTYYRETLPDAVVSGEGATVAITSGGADQTDANVAASEVVYTDGADAGIIGNAMPSSVSFMCRSEERLFLGGGWNPRIITASKIIVPDEAIQFSASPVFQIVLPDDCTGLAYQDGAVVAFTARGIYAITGDGTSDRGDGGVFSPPRAISRDIGCVDSRSILETSVGVFFQGERGFYLLPRGLGQPEYIGMPVELSSASRPYCLGAAYFANRYNRNVRFLTAAANDTSGGTNVLVYDLELGAWSEDTFTSAMLCVGSWNAAAGNVAGVAYALADLSNSNSCGYLEQDLGNSGRDGPSGSAQSYSAIVETNDIFPWGLAGYGQLNALAHIGSGFFGSCTIAILVYLDNSSHAFTWNPGDSSANQIEWWQTVPRDSKCSSFRVRYTLIPGSSFGFAYMHAMQLASVPLGERRFQNTERG